VHLINTQLSVAPGFNGEFEDLVKRLADTRNGRSGYLGQTFLHSYDNPTKYAVTSRWENVQACWDFYRSEAFAEFMKSAPAGIFTGFEQRGYESVFEVDADGIDPATIVADCELLVDWSIDLRPANAAAFEQSRREIFELRKHRAPGFISNRLRRSAGVATKYLILQICKDVASARAGLAVPELAEFAAAHPYSLYASTPPTAEAYFVLSRG
jgi:heme-degrading monooxygenase HmoA